LNIGQRIFGGKSPSLPIVNFPCENVENGKIFLGSAKPLQKLTKENHAPTRVMARGAYWKPNGEGFTPPCREPGSVTRGKGSAFFKKNVPQTLVTLPGEKKKRKTNLKVQLLGPTLKKLTMQQPKNTCKEIPQEILNRVIPKVTQKASPFWESVGVQGGPVKSGNLRGGFG